MIWYRLDGDAELHLFVEDPTGQDHSGRHFCLAVDDVVGLRERLEMAGVAVVGDTRIPDAALFCPRSIRQPHRADDHRRRLPHLAGLEMPEGPRSSLSYWLNLAWSDRYRSGGAILRAGRLVGGLTADASITAFLDEQLPVSAVAVVAGDGRGRRGGEGRVMWGSDCGCRTSPAGGAATTWFRLTELIFSCHFRHRWRFVWEERRNAWTKRDRGR